MLSYRFFFFLSDLPAVKKAQFGIGFNFLFVISTLCLIDCIMLYLLDFITKKIIYFFPLSQLLSRPATFFICRVFNHIYAFMYPVIYLLCLLPKDRILSSIVACRLWNMIEL